VGPSQASKKTPSQPRAGCDGLSWDSEIGRIEVPGLQGQKVHNTLSQQKKMGMVPCACHSSYYGKCD
jgi:hypothetical protein